MRLPSAGQHKLGKLENFNWSHQRSWCYLFSIFSELLRVKVGCRYKRCRCLGQKGRVWGVELFHSGGCSTDPSASTGSCDCTSKICATSLEFNRSWKFSRSNLYQWYWKTRIQRNINETIFWLAGIISDLTLRRTNCVTRRYNQLWPVRPRLDCVNIEKTQKVLRRLRSKWSKSHLGLGQTCGVQDKRQAVILILGRSTRHGMQRWPKSLYWSPSTDRGGKREGIIGKKPCY